MPPYPKRPQMLDEAQKQCKCDRCGLKFQINPNLANMESEQGFSESSFFTRRFRLVADLYGILLPRSNKITIIFQRNIQWPQKSQKMCKTKQQKDRCLLTAQTYIIPSNCKQNNFNNMRTWFASTTWFSMEHDKNSLLLIMTQPLLPSSQPFL